MKRFRLTGYGRRAGAIGLPGAFSITLKAESEAEVRLSVYEYYEHITSLKVEEV